MLTPNGLSALETACCLVFGVDEAEPAHRQDALARHDAAALPQPEVALLDALVQPLLRPPCVVAFSGGRDSSLVLAAALAAARREGLAPPVPVTLRFPADPDSEESLWQERVIDHLGVDEWMRIELPNGLDVVGSVAQRGLSEYGPLFPGNAHIVVPMLEHAAGGTLVSGLGGDELFGLWGRRHLADVAARRTPPRPGDLARIAGALAPPSLRLVALRRRTFTPKAPWLRPSAQAELEDLLARQHVHATLRWDRHALGMPTVRSVTTAMRDIGRIAALGDVAFHSPLLAPRFAASLAAAGGWRGFGGRSATLRALFGDLLPDDVLERRSKATFSHAFFTDETRRFAREWSGEGLDESVVDPGVLRGIWSDSVVDFRSVLLLQSAWCNDHAAARC